MQRTILRNLDRYHLGMMPVTTLFADCQLDLPGTTYTDFRSACSDLEFKGQILLIQGEDRFKAKITDAGRARLLES